MRFSFFSILMRMRETDAVYLDVDTKLDSTGRKQRYERMQMD
jgi:hypothetical protein